MKMDKSRAFAARLEIRRVGPQCARRAVGHRRFGTGFWLQQPPKSL